MDEKSLIKSVLSEPHKRVIAQVLAEIPETGDTFTASEAKRFLKASDDYWKKLINEGLVIPRYLPGKKHPVYVESELRTLFSLRRWDDKIFTEDSETIQITKEDFLGNKTAI